jgi:hypothetical protein
MVCEASVSVKFLLTQEPPGLRSPPRSLSLSLSLSHPQPQPHRCPPSTFSSP